MPSALPSKPKAKAPRPLDNRRSRSRNTTPISAGPTTTSESTPHPPDFPAPSSGSGGPLKPSIEDILDRSGSSQAIPTAATLSGMRESINKDFITPREKNVETTERLIREMARLKKDSEEEERRKLLGKVKVPKRERPTEGKKEEKGDKRPHAAGAHEVARQDGVGVHKDSSSAASSPISAPPSNTGGAAGRPVSAGSASTADDTRQPEPAAPVAHFQTFGPDPSTFDDPTIYHIKDLTSDLTEEERKEILCVANYPHDDLSGLIAGTPPDKDFSNAKPTNQVAAATFSNWVDPYIRPLTEEDIAFLKERTNRQDYRRMVRSRQQNRSPSPNIFVVPRRGSKSYKEIWADEDSRMLVDPDSNRLPPNEPRGDIEQMNDDTAETDEVSLGPVASRLLQTMRPERRNTGDGTNGESATNGVNGDSMDVDDPSPVINGDSRPSAAYFPESNSSSFKANLPANANNYKEYDDRVLQELRHIGFLADDSSAAPEFDEHYDDEISARMRYLQARLKQISIVNGARKRRLLDLAHERMAQQEYNTISDDLDNQLNQAYLKRNRNSSKSKKSQVKRPGVAQAVGVATNRPAQGIGEPIKGLMERKAKWTDWIGPVVNYGKSGIPEDSIFSEEVMRSYIEAETAAWEEDVEEE